MSKYRGPKRDNLDEHYKTPGWAVHRLLERLPAEQLVHFEGHVLSPCAGTGAITAAVESFPGLNGAKRWTLIEKQAKFMPELRALTMSRGNTTRYQVINANAMHVGERRITLNGHSPVTQIIDNPPFSKALSFFRYFRDMAKPGGLFLLLRTSWLETQERHPYLQDDMPDIYTLPQRPSFSMDGATDAASYSWFHWTEKRRSTGRIRLLDITEDR